LAQQTFVNYYEALGVASTCTTKEIRNAYLALAKEQHPDKGGNVQHMRLLNQAYTTLKNSATRNEYDRRYRKYVHGEKVSDLSFNKDEDWDLDEVDEFLSEVFQQDAKRRLWSNPLVTSLAAVSIGILLFVAIAVTRMTVKADSSPATLVNTQSKH
jgi:curved DNA-binding protein CbpA